MIGFVKGMEMVAGVLESGRSEDWLWANCGGSLDEIWLYQIRNCVCAINSFTGRKLDVLGGYVLEWKSLFAYFLLFIVLLTLMLVMVYQL
jgi:hypothetical protein